MAGWHSCCEQRVIPAIAGVLSEKSTNKPCMRILIYLFVLGLAISSCSRQIYIYKTRDFTLPEKSRVYIHENDSMKCSPYYSPAWNLSIMDSMYAESRVRDIQLKAGLSEALNKQNIKTTEQLPEADFVFNYQDYWFCRKKKNLAALYIKIADTKDTSKQALIVNKTFDLTAKLNLEKELSKSLHQYNKGNKHVYSITSHQLNRYPKIKDVPEYPSKQIGLSFGYSLGSFPHSDIQEKYPDYDDGIALHYGGLDIDFYGNQSSGLGLKTIYYFGGNHQNNISQLDNNNNVIGQGELKDHISSFFIGPNLVMRLPFYSYNLLDVIKICPGYLSYSNDALRFGEKVKYKAQTFAFIFSAGLDRKINSKLSIGLEPKFVFAGFKKMDINGQKTTLDKKERLNRIEAAVIFKMN